MSTRFLRDRPWPCRAFYEWVFCFFVFFARYLGFRIFWDIWVVRDPAFPVQKKKRKETHFSKARQGRIKHMSKISESISQKRRGHLDFCAVKCKNHGLASWLLGSECVRFWALNLTYHWFYAVCFSNICVKLCTRMPWSTWKRLCHPLALFMSVSMIPNMWHSSCYCMRHWWLTKIGDLCLNQLVVADPPPPFWLLFCISCYNWWF